VLFRTNHDVYLTGLSHVPSLCLYMNRRLRRKRYVYNATGVPWAEYHDRAKGRPCSRLAERWVHPLLMGCTYAGASGIVCNSRFLASQIAARYPRHRDRVLTIYNGIDFSRYSSGRCRPLPGIEAGDVVLLFVTTLNYGNKSRGLELVIEAFARVHAEHSRTKLVVAAKAANRAYQTWASRLVAERAPAGSALLFWNRPDVPDLLASSDLFVYATPHDSNDSLPRALIEAQTAGLAAVTTATSGCPEIVRNEETGFVVPYEADSMASAILALLRDPELRWRMGSAASSTMLRQFDWEAMADGYAKLFLDIAEETASPPRLAAATGVALAEHWRESFRAAPPKRSL
jgi:glycosyltransferase involved in cell wall biosynthesis